MRRTMQLFRIQLFNLFPIHEIREPGNRKKRAAVILSIGGTAAAFFLCAYNILTAGALAEAGEGALIPAYMVSISSFAVLFLTMFRACGILFGTRDMDLLASLPVKNSEIIGSKFLLMYLMNLLISLIFMIPGGIVWIADVKTDLPHFALFLSAAFFVPLVPMCLASVISLLIVLASSHFKSRNIVSLLLSFSALGLVGYIAVSSIHSEGDMGNVGAMLAKQITGLYPLSGLFLKSAGGKTGVGLFLVLSAAVFSLFLKVTSANYCSLNALAGAGSKYSKRRFPLKKHTPFSALFRKELGRFFSSYTAVLNAGFGVLLLCVFSVLLLLLPPEQLGEYAGIENMSGFLSDYAPVVVAALLSLSCPAASSVSLEGKNVWILQSAPVAIKTMIDSKLAVNILLHLFGYLPAVCSILIRLHMTALQIAGLLWIPVCYSFFIAVLGLFLNQRYPNYDWDSEVMVVKQSLPAIVAGIAGMVCVAAPVLLNWFLSVSILSALWITAGTLTAAAAIMYHKLCRLNYL